MRAEEFHHYSYFRTPSPLAEKCILVSDGMGCTSQPDFRINRKSYYNFLAFYVQAGRFHVEQYGNVYMFSQGDVGILNLMDPHVYYSASEDQFCLLWFHFRGGGTDMLMEGLEQNALLPVRYHMPELEQDFLTALSLTRSRCAEQKLAGHLYGLLMKILENTPQEIWGTASIPPELQRAADFMAKQLDANLTLDQISAEAGMGKYHFCHMFKKWYGISPLQYYVEKRMERACVLLLESKLPIDEIAARLGYLDVGYFRKVFKNYFGITPSAYRKCYA